MNLSKEWITADSPGVPEENRDAVNMQLNSPDGTFFISYVPDMDAARTKFNTAAIRPPGWTDPDETTIVIRRGFLGMPQYVPLPGDHRKAYEDLIDQGLQACLDYYRKHTVDLPVICDMSCSQDWTNRPESGGFMLDSNGVCPECAPRVRASCEKHGELDHITKECPPDMSYADFIREVRRG